MLSSIFLVIFAYTVAAACRTDSPEQGGYPGVAGVEGVATELIAYPPPATQEPATPYPTWTPEPTATSTATVTPTGTELPEPVVVGVRLAEAEAEVLSWLDPTRAPRIEWSQYVRRSDLVAALQAEGWPRLLDKWPMMFDDRQFDELGDPLIIVVASSHSMPGVAAVARIGSPPSIGLSDQLAQSTQRISVVGVFDAITGDRRAAVADSPDDSWTVPEELRSADAEFRRDARRTVTPWPGHPVPGIDSSPQGDASVQVPTASLTSLTERLTRSNLYAELQPTFGHYRFAPGSYWTWRFTYANAGGVRWVSDIVTETIEDAWLDEGGTAVIRSRVDVQSLTPERNRDGDWVVQHPREVVRHVGPGTMSVSGQGPSNPPYVTPSADVPFGLDAISEVAGVAVDMSLTLLPGVRDSGGLTWIGEEPVTVTTGAGVFNDCWLIKSAGGASFGSRKWLCEGVGIVLYEFRDCAMYHSSTATADLIDYHIAELPEG